MPSHLIFAEAQPPQLQLTHQEIVDLLWSSERRTVWCSVEHAYLTLTPLFATGEIQARCWSGFAAFMFRALRTYPQLQLDDIRVELSFLGPGLSRLAAVVPLHPMLERGGPRMWFDPRPVKPVDPQGRLCKVLFEFILDTRFSLDDTSQMQIVNLHLPAIV